MYFSIGFVLLALLLIVLFFWRRRISIRRVSSMAPMEKSQLLSSIIKPLGFFYDSRQDIISSRNDAWQREMGYTAFFDRAAPSFNMVFDYLPIYFPYQKRTWLIQFWKGQYGINTGAEVGVYYADRLLCERELATTHFRAVDNTDMLPISFYLTKNDTPIANVSKHTWWLTAFSMGRFSAPSQLNMNIAIDFPTCEMRSSFLDALYNTGISKNCVNTCGTEVQINFFGEQNRRYGFFTRLRRRMAQFFNRIFCRIYCNITNVFCLTVDRLLYLYYLLPFAFRRMLRPRRYRRCRRYRRQYRRQSQIS